MAAAAWLSKSCCGLSLPEPGDTLPARSSSELNISIHTPFRSVIADKLHFTTSTSSSSTSSWTAVEAADYNDTECTRPLSLALSEGFSPSEDILNTHGIIVGH